MPATKLLRIHGRVQGVGFRAGLLARARARGIAGWVRNRSDGSVEALVHAPAATLEPLLTWVQHGPAAARVERVETTDLPPSGEDLAPEFEWRPTL